MTGNGDRCLVQVCRFADHHNSKTCRGLQRFEPKQDFFNTIIYLTVIRTTGLRLDSCAPCQTLLFRHLIMMSDATSSDETTILHLTSCLEARRKHKVGHLPLSKGSPAELYIAASGCLLGCASWKACKAPQPASISIKRGHFERSTSNRRALNS